MSAPMTRIASSPSRSRMTNDWTKSSVRVIGLPRIRSARARPVASSARSVVELRRRGAASGAAPEGGERRLELGGEARDPRRARPTPPARRSCTPRTPRRCASARCPAAASASTESSRRSTSANTAAASAPDSWPWKLRTAAMRRGRALHGDAERLGHLRVGHPGGGAEAAEPGRHLARGGRIPEQRGVRRGRPAVRRAEPGLEGGHGRAGHADGDAAVEVEGRDVHQPHAVRQRAGRRSRGRVRPGRPRGRRARGSRRSSAGTPARHARARAPRRGPDPHPRRSARPGRSVSARAATASESGSAVRLTAAIISSSALMVARRGFRWQALGGAACLGQEEAGLLHLGGHDDPAPRDADRGTPAPRAGPSSRCAGRPAPSRRRTRATAPPAGGRRAAGLRRSQR